MTSRERLMAAITGKEPDRVPVKIWSLTKGARACHPSFQPLIDAGLEHTDLVGGWRV